MNFGGRKRALSLLAKAPWGRARKKRILAIKLGLNPNSSSLGVDVSFLLFGSAAISILTPFIGAVLRLKSARGDFQQDESRPSRNDDASRPQK